MKLPKSYDLQQLLLELGEADNHDPTFVAEKLWLKREPMLQGLLNFRKHQEGEANWRKHPWKYRTGIKKFHKSTEGKRFHRALGHFLASRIFRPKIQVSPFGLQRENENYTLQKFPLLTAISSIRTHLYLDREYYFNSLQESIDVASFIDYSIPLLQSIESHLFEDFSYELDEEEMELLLRLVDRKKLLESLSELSHKPYTELSTIYNEQFDLLKKTVSTYAENFLTKLFTKIASLVS